MNTALETALDQVRDIARVVDMRVREHHRIDRTRLVGQLLVDPIGVIAPTLIDSAIQQQALAGDKMGVLLDNEKRDLLERDELDEEGLAQLAAERATRPVQPEQVNEMQGIAALMAATPLNPEKGIKTYRKYKTKQISLSNEE